MTRKSPIVRIPETGHDVPQDEEWCYIQTPQRSERIRFHDYGRIYDVPGLYEALFHEKLQCASPETVTGLLRDAMREDGVDPSETPLHVLELGAGNGIVGERLQRMGADTLVGVDVIPEAAAAARRDRPGVYDDYIVDDLSDPRPETRARLDRDFNVLVTVAALGFDDLPPDAFAGGYNAVEDGGWIAFNIKDAFVVAGDGTGFGGLIGEMVDRRLMKQTRRVRYRHRLSMTGEPLHYVAFVGRKMADIPEDVVTACG